MKKLFENEIHIEREYKLKTVYTGKFKIILPEIFGFCQGVISALKKLENIIGTGKLKSKSSNSIYLLGEIIHNSTVNQDVTSAGVIIIPESKINDVFKVAKIDDYIVIPAFGIPLDLEIKIRKQYKNIVDTTCDNVKSVWNFISTEAEKGSTILLYGKPGHPEVKASISRANKSNCVIVLPSLDSARYFAEYMRNNFPSSGINESNKDLPQGDPVFFYNRQHFNPKRFALANQTTMLYDETRKVEKIIRKAINFKHSSLIACDTICKATYMRQKAAIEVCRHNPDMIIVVGGYDSSNTTHLYKLAGEYAPTYYIRDAGSINHSRIIHFLPNSSEETRISTKQALKNVSTIAILAGASCPFTVINKIIKKLETI